MRLADGVPLTVMVPNAGDAAKEHVPGGGSKVRLSWAPEHMHIVRESATKAASAES